MQGGEEKLRIKEEKGQREKQREKQLTMPVPIDNSEMGMLKPEMPSSNSFVYDMWKIDITGTAKKTDASTVRNQMVENNVYLWGREFIPNQEVSDRLAARRAVVFGAVVPEQSSAKHIESRPIEDSLAFIFNSWVHFKVHSEDINSFHTQIRGCLKSPNLGDKHFRDYLEFIFNGHRHYSICAVFTKTVKMMEQVSLSDKPLVKKIRRLQTGYVQFALSFATEYDTRFNKTFSSMANAHAPTFELFKEICFVKSKLYFC